MACHTMAIAGLTHPTPQALNLLVPPYHLDGDCYCEGKLSCPQTQCNDPGQDSNLDYSTGTWHAYYWATSDYFLIVSVKESDFLVLKYSPNC